MSTAAPPVSWDNRPAIAKRRRAELYGFLEHLDIPFPIGCPKNTAKSGTPKIMGMLERLEAAGIDINVPHKYFEWQVVNSQNEHGQMHQHIEPVSPLHESARLQAEGQEIDYDRIMTERAEAAAAAAQKDEQIDAQSDALQAMMARIELLEANSLPLANMSPPQLKGMAKRRGLDFSGLKTKADLIALLEG